MVMIGPTTLYKKRNESTKHLHHDTKACAICREYSKQLNESRLKVLQARENAVHELINDAQQGLTSFSKDQQKYKTLLADLLVQVRCSILLYAASLHRPRSNRSSGTPLLSSKSQ